MHLRATMPPPSLLLLLLLLLTPTWVRELLQVPDLPPAALGYVQLPGGMWVHNATGPVLLQDRPRYPLDDTTWDDHKCGELYVPTIMAAPAVVVPQWIYTAAPQVAAAAG
jgi:hypothetical protein